MHVMCFCAYVFLFAHAHAFNAPSPPLLAPVVPSLPPSLQMFYNWPADELTRVSLNPARKKFGLL